MAREWIVTGTSMVVEADDQFEAVDRAQDSSGWHWEAVEQTGETPRLVSEEYQRGVADAIAAILKRPYPSAADRNATGGYRGVYVQAIRALLPEDR